MEKTPVKVGPPVQEQLVKPIAMTVRPVHRIVSPMNHPQIPIEIENIMSVVPPKEKKLKKSALLCPVDDVKVEYFEN